MNPDLVWKLVLDDLEVSLSQGNFSTWVKKARLVTIEPVGENRQIAELACPSSFHQKMLEARYYAQTKDAFDRITKKQTELRFVVSQSPSSSSVDDTPLFSPPLQHIDDVDVQRHRMGLNPDFTFDTFAVSSSNEMAHAAALAVADGLGGAYNPLFLYGDVGVGKTHLMQAIANKALEIDSRLALVFCAGEEFTNEIIDAIQQKKTPEFRRRYRKAKGLFIDDVQFIAGKTTVQEEFFHTFNAVMKAGGQVVMTSDRPPEEINNLEDRLRSRFEGGLLIDIGNPNFELRTAILLIKAQQRSIRLPMEAAQAVAANIESIRKMEGFLVRLVTESKTKGLPISAEMVQALLGKKVKAAAIQPNSVRPIEVIRAVARYFNLTPKDLRGPRRIRPIMVPRQVAMYLLRLDMGLPLTEIGGLFSGRDHTTVMHSVDKITQELSVSDSLRVDLANLRKELRV